MIALPSRSARQSLLLTLALLASVSACRGAFQPRKYATSAALFTASLDRLNKNKYDDAVAGFEKLTLDLGARDSLLPLSQWYLGQAHVKRDENLLAAQSFTKLAETFPDDSLGDDALLAAGDAYLRMWRRPSLDPAYGQTAQIQYRLLLSVYPESPLRERAELANQRVDELLATKDYETGMHYFRRRAFDSGLIYFKDVVRLFPNTDHARMALLRMVDTYRHPLLNYKEDAAETCQTLRTSYPTDAEVQRVCPDPAAVKDSTATVPAKPPVLR
ncbi:MAG: outer membrane protein assembly factor BamD [Gemmatimonadaceae bacterium]|nr:outer membrane protein assembly factor BamD [Gemmatimonadaceae bacterium]